MIFSIVSTLPRPFLVALLSFLVAGVGDARADVIISEIMYNASGSDTDREWVEIFNSGVTDVNLSGWTFRDVADNETSNPFPNGTILGAGEALALVENSSFFDAQWGASIDRIQLGNWPATDNSGTDLAIYDNLNVIHDQVNYDDDGDWPMDLEPGKSISLLPNYLNSTGNNDGTHWRSTVAGVEGAYFGSVSSDRGLDEMASPGYVATTPQVFPAFTPSPDASWSMVVFPDTQNYVKRQEHMPLFEDMANWVKDNKNTFNIELVVQEGDIVNENSNEWPGGGENPATLQWQNARNTMGILNNEVPYIMAAGNHDYYDDPTRLNDFFSASDNPLVDPHQGGILKGTLEPGKLENAYYEMTAPDGRELLIFSLGWEVGADGNGNGNPDFPAESAAGFAWANGIAGLSQYENHTAMLLTHSYARNDTSDPFGKGELSDEGKIYWDEFVEGNENIEMVLSGHKRGDGAALFESTRNDGSDVTQMLFNTQVEGNGGNGWIRLFEFLDDGKTVRVRTYSPTFGFIRDDVDNAFTFELTELIPADFNFDGVVDDQDLAIWNTGFGTSGAAKSEGDANGDGTVDGLDFLLWQRGFDSGTTGTAASATVPEPGSMTLASGLLALLLVRPESKKA